ncbi:acyl-CoA thioesterase II [Allofranklinella schreckenbergeri]|uniref:Acyl-CoA thioesterase 2 n=1 Tax=Allofranklinella schreckenbergeri TaxID=1076744 RepID=A0A3M6R2D0_9BURK|nr:acyl-CoA thioesterase II [Allofranklinella schreckenbergeri]RMW97739.1 acyl-CoA thioesterase II [Allofranklinella schreckenbergeri]RMX09387.1 acyl-CoA thioesterase II [Allofranklinella schreckenbergeri]RRD42641.1 acyl-CoA thioesterase II [Comamonadaceae bacterium OH3737_COT-264]
MPNAVAPASPISQVEPARLQALNHLIAQLQLEQLEMNLFRGISTDIGSPAVFGGQVLGQALMAAARTVRNGHRPHSLHGYFLLAGDKTAPIVYEVDAVRDGHAFTSRRVTAIQHGQAIFHMSASFHQEEPGHDHQSPMPQVPEPDHATPHPLRSLALARPFELGFIDVRETRTHGRLPPFNRVWVRTCAPVIPDDPIVHQALLAYISDFSLLGVALRPHGLYFGQPGLKTVSLDHAMWFHRPFRADEWLLYDLDSPSASGARGFARGALYNQRGELIASVAQEGLMRYKAPAP